MCANAQFMIEKDKPMKAIRILLPLVFVTFLFSCSEQLYRAAEMPYPDSARYRHYNEPIESAGFSVGATHLNSRFTGVRENQMLAGDRISHYLGNTAFAAGGYYRIGLTPPFGIQLGLDYFHFTGSMGLDEDGREDFKLYTSNQRYINEFNNHLLSFSFLPYYQLPVFMDRPQQRPKAKRVFLYGGFAGNLLLAKLVDDLGNTIEQDDPQSPEESMFGFSLPLGLGFSYRLNRNFALEYLVDYRIYLGNHPSGIIDSKADDLHLYNRLGVTYRIR